MMKNNMQNKPFKNQLPQIARAANAQKGVVLIEALIALLIFSMGILALVGLQAAMIKNTTENKLRADASFIAQQQLGRIWAGDHANLANLEGETDVNNILPNGKAIIAVGARGLVTATVTWQSPGEEPHRYEASTYIDSRFSE